MLYSLVPRLSLPIIPHMTFDPPEGKAECNNVPGYVIHSPSAPPLRNLDHYYIILVHTFKHLIPAKCVLNINYFLPHNSIHFTAIIVQQVNRDMTVKAKNGKEYYLVEVIAHILKYLKDQLLKKLKGAGYELEATDFDWVITVPAIWRARGKQMMREAGYKVHECFVGLYMPAYMSVQADNNNCINVPADAFHILLLYIYGIGEMKLLSASVFKRL